MGNLAPMYTTQEVLHSSLHCVVATGHVFCSCVPTADPIFPRLSTVTGVEKVFDLGEISDFEKAGLAALLPDLIASIEVGLDYAKKQV